jgi:hypothetical protein
MKRSELKNMVKEAISDLNIDISKAKVGSTQKIDGVTTTLTNINPETGKLTWDVKYEVEPEQLYNKLDDLVDFLKEVPKDSEMGKIKDIIKQLRNKTSRLMK